MIPTEYSRSEKILDDIVAECEEIRRANGYRMDVAYVHRVPLDEDKIGEMVKKEFPLLSAWLGEETVAFTTVGSIGTPPVTDSVIMVNLTSYVRLSPHAGDVKHSQVDEWGEPSLHDLRKIMSKLCFKYSKGDGRWQVLQTENPKVVREYKPDEEWASVTLQFMVWTIAQDDTWQ